MHTFNIWKSLTFLHYWSLLGKVDRQYLTLLPYLKSTHPLLKNVPVHDLAIPNALPYLMSRYFDDCMYIKGFTKGQNTQIDIYFFFFLAMQLKFEIDPLYQSWLFDTFNNCQNLHIYCNISLFDMHWATRLTKMHCIQSLNIKTKVSCNYPVDWTR